MGVRGLLSKRICNRLEVREAGSGVRGMCGVKRHVD
jgi:hypothetical protein